MSLSKRERRQATALNVFKTSDQPHFIKKCRSSSEPKKT
jgi:hypothetical protein